MDQVYRSFRKFGTIILAMFMFVSIFDAQLIDAEGSNSTAKITHACDEQNVQVYESNGELMIPWNSAIETATSDLVKYTSYEATMQEHVWSTPDELKLIVQEENSGETKTLIEGTDFEILYKSDDGLYEADKEKVKTFQGFKLLFHKEESFFKLVIHYNTFGKISDLTESEENRSFITAGSWKVENDEFINQETTHTYSNPNYKPVENTEPVETTQISETNNNLNKSVMSASSQSDTDSNGMVPPSLDADIVYPENYKVWPDVGVDEENHLNSENGNYKFGDFGEKYDLFYILANYNVFSFENYDGSHVVGPMIVGGNTKSSGLGGVSHRTDGITEYPHTVPSYFKGNVSNNTITTSSYVPVFIGQNLDSTGQDANKNQQAYTLLGPELEVKIENEKYFKYRNYYFVQQNKNEDYVNFDFAKQKFTEQIKQYQNPSYTDTDAAGNSITSIVIKTTDFEKVKNVGDKQKSEDGTYYFERTDDSGGKTGLRLKLGYNYIFEKELFNKIDYIVYDYDNMDEATTMTTFLNVPDSNKITFPGIYKSKSDILGTVIGINENKDSGIQPAYEFTGQAEVQKAFNIAYFIPESTQVLIDDKSHLAGHLVALNAHVDINCGDYNGAVIARDISSKAEGHMWPYKLDTSVTFDKTVNGKKPEDGETFTFNLKNIYKPKSAVEIVDQTAKSNSNGRVFFPIKDLKVKGDYIYEISEQYPGSGYAKNDTKYYALVSLEESTSSLAGGKVVPVFEGFYTDCTFDENGKPILSEELSQLKYNNKREFGVLKEWYDQNDNLLTGDGMPEINGTLIQKYVEDTGYVVTFNLYVQLNGGGSKTLVKTLNTKGLKKNSEYKVKIGTILHTNIDSVTVVSGVASVENKDSDYVIKNITENTVVDIIVTDHNGILDESVVTLDLLEQDPSNLSYVAGDPVVGTHEYQSFKLNEENHWYQGFENLPSSGNVKGYGEKHFKYYYYVEESPITGFITTYQNNGGTLTGTIKIQNKEIPQDLIIKKVSSTGNNDFLKGAEFKLTDISNPNKKVDMKFQYDESKDIYKLSDEGSSTLVTNGKSNLHIEKLPVGNYLLTETKAPGEAGDYEIDFKDIFIHIDRDKEKSYYALGKDAVPIKEDQILVTNENSNFIYTDTSDMLTYTITVENTPLINMPETGGTFDGMYQKLGFLIACCGMVMFTLYECKRNKNIKKNKN